MIALRTALASLLLTCSCAHVPQPNPGPLLVRAPYAPDSGTLLIRSGRLIDGLSADVATGVDILVENGRISRLGRDVEPPAGTPVLDLTAYTVLPGLIDTHTHLADTPGTTAELSVYYTRSFEEQVALGRENVRDTLLAGFTAARDLGTYIAWTDKALRDAIDAGELVGPRMQVAGFYLTIPGGGGDLVIPGFDEDLIPSHVRAGVARGPSAFRERAQAAVDGGADVLKIIASGAVLAYGGIPGAPEMTPEEIEAVVAVGHAAGLKVTAHAHGAQSIRDAILAGADSIEHASLIDDETIALARDRGVALSMDVYNGTYIATEGKAAGWPAEFLRKNDETTEAQRRGFSRAHRAGVEILYGTDSAVYPHGDNAKQFGVMVERGMSPMEAIRAATSVPARHMGWYDRVGAIAVGRLGDVIAVAGDPLRDITALEDVAVVVKGGLVFKAPDNALGELPRPALASRLRRVTEGKE